MKAARPTAMPRKTDSAVHLDCMWRGTRSFQRAE